MLKPRVGVRRRVFRRTGPTRSWPGALAWLRGFARAQPSRVALHFTVLAIGLTVVSVTGLANRPSQFAPERAGGVSANASVVQPAEPLAAEPAQPEAPVLSTYV